MMLCMKEVECGLSWIYFKDLDHIRQILIVQKVCCFDFFLHLQVLQNTMLEKHDNYTKVHNSAFFQPLMTLVLNDENSSSSAYVERDKLFPCESDHGGHPHGHSQLHLLLHLHEGQVKHIYAQEFYQPWLFAESGILVPSTAR